MLAHFCPAVGIKIKDDTTFDKLNTDFWTLAADTPEILQLELDTVMRFQGFDMKLIIRENVTMVFNENEIGRFAPSAS